MVSWCMVYGCFLRFGLSVVGFKLGGDVKTDAVSITLFTVCCATVMFVYVFFMRIWRRLLILIWFGPIRSLVALWRVSPPP